MALTRKSLKAMGLTDEQVDSVVEMHGETVEGLNAEIEKYKGDAEQLPAVQKELDDLKASGWKEKHDKIKKDFDDYKAEIESKETKAAKEKAVRAYFESKNIEGANLNIAMRSSAAEIDAIELDGDNIKDTSALDALITGDYANLVTKPGVRVDTGAKLNNSGGAMSRKDIMSISDRAERRAAIAANMNVFEQKGD